MNREEAKKILKDHEPDFLQPARKKVNGHITYVCPVCGNGEGQTGDGIALVPNAEEKRFKCFKCGLNEDIVGLYKKHAGITDDSQAFRDLYKMFNIHVDMNMNTPTYTHEHTHNNEEAKDYMKYYEECAQRVGMTDYLTSRGLSKEVIEQYQLGYDPYYSVGYGKTWQAVIIPIAKNKYVARNVDRGAVERYRKSKGPTSLYLKKMLKVATEPIYIVEGEIDALSIIEVGAPAIALGSTANTHMLVNEVMSNKPVQPLIIALDNDKAGLEAGEKLTNELRNIGIKCYMYNPYGEAKDANEALLADREAFKKNINQGKDLEKELYLRTSTAYKVQDFINGVADSVNTPYIPTGFNKLDKVLDGGLYEGLYTIGAISSLGKTTFVLQIADNIAEAGTDVLIFSLEMGTSELMAKSISRLTILDVLENNGNTRDAKTVRGITVGSRYPNYSKTERDLIYRSVEKYQSYAEHIYIHEGIGNIGVEQVKAVVNNHIKITGNRPVVIIDYMQILAPADIRASDKQNTDKAMLELKRMSRDYKVPVISVSSVNRQNYSSKASMEMLKESGAIEYGSDVIWGLQLKGAGEKGFNVDEAKNKNPREVELIILKNRNGATGGKLDFSYYPMFNYFKEAE